MSWSSEKNNIGGVYLFQYRKDCRECSRHLAPCSLHAEESMLKMEQTLGRRDKRVKKLKRRVAFTNGMLSILQPWRKS